MPPPGLGTRKLSATWVSAVETKYGCKQEEAQREFVKVSLGGKEREDIHLLSELALLAEDGFWENLSKWCSADERDALERRAGVLRVFQTKPVIET